MDSFHSPISILHFLEGSYYRQPTPRRKELLCPLFEDKYLHKLFGIPNGGFVSSFPFMNWLNHVFMSAWAHENLFYILAVIQSYFILLLLYRVGWLLCSLAYSHQCGCWLFFKALPLFLVLPDTSDSSCIFLPPILELAISLLEIGVRNQDLGATCAHCD